MANIARPPCDEAAILAGSCERAATTNGPWILAATILGSSMAFIDGTVVNVAHVSTTTRDLRGRVQLKLKSRPETLDVTIAGGEVATVNGYCAKRKRQ